MRTFQYIITNLGINFLVITLPKITKQKRDIKKNQIVIYIRIICIHIQYLLLL